MSITRGLDDMGKKIDLSTFNTLGLDDSEQLTEAQQFENADIIEDFCRFISEIDDRSNRFLQKCLYGDLEKDQAKAIIQQHESVQEGMDLIPGIPSDEEYQNYKKSNIVVPILVKLGDLCACAHVGKIYKSNFVELKRQLLDLLLSQFGCHLDLDIFEFAVDELKKFDMIPEHMDSGDMVYYCALGRWY